MGCRIKNVKANFKEHFKPDLVCSAGKSNECNQRHLLECQALIGSNELFSYIPNYEDVFNDEDTREQNYIATLMFENLKRKKLFESENLNA